jgi:hypothetical protein
MIDRIDKVIESIEAYLYVTKKWGIGVWHNLCAIYPYQNACNNKLI